MKRHWLINPTWECQNRCAYCWLNDSVRAHPELLGAEPRPVDDWIAAIRRDKIELVDIAGGEPLLTGYIPELIAGCPGTVFGLSTNGARWDELERLYGLANLVSVNISLHPRTPIQLWRRAILAARRSRLRLHVNVVDWRNTANIAAPHLRWLNSLQVKWVVNPWEDVAELANLQTTGLVCDGGVSHLVVAPDGMAWPCLSGLRSPLWADYRLGNWLDGDVDVELKPQPCFLRCVDYYVLPQQHSAGDMWGVNARPCDCNV